jgi:hypothetical protein
MSFGFPLKPYALLKSHVRISIGENSSAHVRLKVNEAAALTSQRVLGAREKLRRAVARLLVAETAVRDLLLRAKHLVFAAIVACRIATGAFS